MHKKHLFVFIFYLCFLIGLWQSTQNADQLKKMLLSSEQTYDNILALVEQTKTYSNRKNDQCFKNTIKITSILRPGRYFNRRYPDPLKLYRKNKVRQRALMLLLEKKFIESEIKKAPLFRITVVFLV